MKRLALVIALSVVLLVSVACATTGTGQGDGLHSTIPDIVGLEQTQAEGQLSAKGYTLGDITKGPADGGAFATITKQDPIAGTSAPRGTKVNVTVTTPTTGQ